MAIAFDSATQGGVAANAVLTFSHTVSGSHTILWVGFTANKAVVPAISSVKYNGVSMTATADTPQNPSGDTTVKAYLYWLVAPTTGANNVVITFASAPDEIHANAVSYTGASQTGVPDSHMSVSSSGTSATLTTTTVAANAWLVGIFRNNSAGNGSAGTGTTQRSSVTGQNSFDDNNGLATTPGSYSIQETFGSAAYAGVGASFAPFVTVTANSGFLRFM